MLDHGAWNTSGIYVIMLTKTLNDQGTDICSNEDASVPSWADERDAFASSQSYGATEHHVYGSCKEQRTHEEKYALSDERAP